MSKQTEEGEELTVSVARFIDSHDLIASGAGVLVGVSGGADSVALLAVLRDLASQGQRRWRLTVAHMHHGLREDADADAEFVAELAGKWDLPCVIERRDVAAEARRRRIGIEEAGRTLRYAFLGRTADRAGASYVAVGHHADDNVETILHRILRGTHLRGLAGMLPARKLEGSEILLVRPLLTCRRQQIEAFCHQRGLKWRTDATNMDVRYQRNFIRHELLPLLRDKLNPRVDEALLRLAAAADQAESYLLAQAQALLDSAKRQGPQGALVLDRASIACQPDVVRKVILRRALEELRAPLGGVTAERFEQLSALFNPAGPAAVALPGKLLARREGDRIVIAPAGKAQEAAPAGVSLFCPGLTELADGLRVTCEIQPLETSDFGTHRRHHRQGVELLDADLIRGALVCRPRRDGDVFHPLGCSGRQSVSDFLTNLKLSSEDRTRVRCVCDEAGIVCLMPLRIDERVKVTPQTHRVLRITAEGFAAQSSC